MTWEKRGSIVKKAQELGYEVAPEILADIESAQTID